MEPHTLSLTKGDRRYVFRYSGGCEDQIIDEIIRLAEDGETNFDWLDAAALSFQVTRYVAVECQYAIDPAAKQSQ